MQHPEFITAQSKFRLEKRYRNDFSYYFASTSFDNQKNNVYIFSLIINALCNH